jgi:hypothetical protein
MQNEEKDRIVRSLEKMGLSNYEARAYLAAINQPAMTGYKLSKLSGVPRSRIYETIEKLIAKGLVMFQSSEKTLLSAVDSAAFLDKKKKESQDHHTFLEESLPKLNTMDDPGIWSVTGRAMILKTIKELMNDAQKYVYMSLFSNDLSELEDMILATRKRNIPVWGIFCGKSTLNLENFYAHLGGSCSTCNEICICVDGEQALIGCTQPSDIASAALTRNKGFINITEQYIKHEIFINRQFSQQDREAIKHYIENYEKTMSQLP